MPWLEVDGTRPNRRVRKSKLSLKMRVDDRKTSSEQQLNSVEQAAQHRSVGTLQTSNTQIRVCVDD